MSQLAIIPLENSKFNAATNPALQAALRSRPKRKQPKKKQKTNIRKATKPLRNTAAQLPLHIRQRVTSCSLQYASALADPENTPMGACVPFGFPTPTQKAKNFMRGRFALGTTGHGYVLFNGAIGNNDNTITLTGATSVGTQSTALNAFTNLTNYGFGRLPFTAAQLASASAPMGSRLVAFCLKIRYAGTEAGRNGIIYSIEEPDHNTLASGTGDAIMNFSNTSAHRPDPLGKWTCVNWSGPVRAQEAQLTSGSSTMTNPCICIFISGAASDLYEWEAYIHMEYAGAIALFTTPSMVESMYNNVVDAMKRITALGPLSDENNKTAFQSFLASVGNTAKTLAFDYGLPALAGMISPRLMPLVRPALKSSQLLLTNG